jgi:membrane protein DedA with SNARE-associated domain
MTGLDEIVGQWGYLAIFVVVVLGNCGIPVPEESILILAGYLVWRGELKFFLALAVGIVSACVGDNLGFWLGRRYGRQAIDRYGASIFITPRRFQAMERFVTRYGVLSVFSARFFPGLRIMAGPLAAIAGMPYRSFFTANIAGAVLYVPVVLGIGYGIGLGFDNYVERVERVVGRIEYVVLFGIIAVAFVLLAYRILLARTKRSGRNMS